MAIRHDRDLAALHSQTSFIVFMGTQKEGILQNILEESKQWHQNKQLGKTTVPLRMHLLHGLLQTLMTRVDQLGKASQTDVLWTQSIQSKLILQDGSWPYLMWNPKAKALEINGDKKAISMQDMASLLQQLQQHLSPDSVIRFHAMKSAKPDLQVIPWKLELNVRMDAFHQVVHQLCHNAVWQLVCCRVRPNGLQQSKLAEELQKTLKHR